MALRSREIAPLALAQLEAWRAYASRWYWHCERRDTETGHRLGEGKQQYHAVCAVCDTSIAVLASEGIGYLMNTEQMLDAVTRHLRNVHRGVEAEVYGDDRQDATIDTGARGRGDSNGTNPNPGGLQAQK